MEKKELQISKQPPVLQAILEKNSKLELIRKFNSLSLDVVIHEKYPSFGLCEKTYGTPKVQTALMVLLADLNTTFKGTLNKDEIEEAAVEIMTRTRQLSFEDAFLVIKQLKVSKINFAGLSVNQILSLFEQHLENKMNRAAEISLNKHLSKKNHFEQFEMADKLLIFSESKKKHIEKLQKHNRKKYEQ